MCHWTLSSVNAITSYNTSDNSVHFHPSKEFWIWCPNRQKILQSLHIILKNKNRFDGSQKVENSCNYCNDHFKTKFVFIHHKMSQHVVNCNLAIIVSFTSNENHHVSGDVVQLLLPEGFESGVGVGFSFQWIWIWTWIKKGGGDLGHPKTHFDDPKYLEWAKSDQYSSFSRWSRWRGPFWDFWLRLGATGP